MTNWLDLARVLNGQSDPTTLDNDTRKEFEAIAREPKDEQDIKASDVEAADFWRAANEAEVAIASKTAELGDGTPELDQWLDELIQMRPQPVEEKPKRSRTKRK